MGNPLLKNYNIDKDPFLTAGFNNLWKIYKGSRKDRKQDVCVFVLEKKNLDKYSKEEREEIMNVLKREAGALVKFKHPNIISIYETLLEDKTTLVYVTEPIQYTLSSWVEGTGASKLEIKLMITELCNLISFLHDDAHVIHTALNPDEIYLNEQGHIKISGLSFSISDPSLNGTEFKLNSLFPNALPNLKYVAPEIVYDSKAYYNSDLFSIGMIIHNLLKFHKGGRDRDLIKLNGNNTPDAYKRVYGEMESFELMRLAFESDDNDVIFKCVNKLPLSRPTIKEILEHQWFNDPKLKALRFIENIEQNEAQKNSEFLTKFPNILHMFENKIIERRFIPVFMNALKNESLIVNILPAIFCICESNIVKLDFEQIIWPGLKNLFQMKQMPAAALYFLLSKLNYIAEKISNSEFSGNMLNIICKALDCGVAKIQSVVLENLLFIVKKVDSLAFKNQIYPRLVNVLTNTTSATLKINILKSFTTVYSLLDQNIINESLLNTLEKVRKVDNNPEVCMCVVSIYEEIAKVVSIESIANKILPNLISILVSGNISKKNFENIMNLVQKYLSRIKDSREKDLTDDSNKFEDKDLLNKNTNNSNSVNNNKNDKDDFGFLDSFFGGASSNKKTNPSSNNNFNIPETTINSGNTKNTFEFDFPDKNNFDSGLNSKKDKTIFDGIKDSSVTVVNNNLSGNNLYQLDFNNSSSNQNVLNLGKTLQNQSNSNLPSSNNFNNLVNKKQQNTFQDVDFSKTINKNNSKGSDLNMLDSLLNDIPNSDKNTISSNNTNFINNNINFSSNTQNNLNNWDLNFDNNKKNITSPIGMNNNLNNSTRNLNLNDNEDFYSLDFLKNNNKGNNQNMGTNLNSGMNNFNLDFTSGLGKSNAPQNDNNNLSGFNFSNTNMNTNYSNKNNQNDPNKNILNGLLKF